MADMMQTQAGDPGAFARFDLARVPSPCFVIDVAKVEANLQVLADVGLEHLANTRANELSIGENRLLQMARLLMARPRLLLLDEPTSGINPDVQQLLAALIRRLREDEGISFLIIEHSLGFIRALCERLYVMHLGEVISSGDPGKVATDPIVIETYLGAS